MTELDRKISEIADEYRGIENGWQRSPEHLDHLVWIRLSLLANELTRVKDRHGSRAVHARAEAAEARKHYDALAIIDEEEGQRTVELENLAVRIGAEDQDAVSAERAAISAEFLGIGIVNRLSQAGIPDEFLRSSGRHRPREIVLNLLIAEEAILFESHKGRQAPLPTLSSKTGKYRGEFFDFVMSNLPVAAAAHGIKLDGDGFASAIGSRIKRVIPLLRNLKLAPIV